MDFFIFQTSFISPISHKWFKAFPLFSQKGINLKWKTVQLPEDLLDRVDKVVKQESLGYSSRAEFIKEAVRLRLEEVEKKLKKKTLG